MTNFTSSFRNETLTSFVPSYPLLRKTLTSKGTPSGHCNLLASMPKSMSAHEVVGGTRMHVVIVGLMGVGKSTVGKLLAKRMDRPYVDSDDDIELLTGVSGRHYCGMYGVKKLHELEAAVTLGALAREERSVITAAASVVESDVVRLALGRCAVVVRLSIDSTELMRRQGSGDHRRPMDAASLAALERLREPLFSEVEDMYLRADRDPALLVDSVMRFLEIP